MMDQSEASGMKNTESHSSASKRSSVSFSAEEQPETRNKSRSLKAWRPTTLVNFIHNKYASNISRQTSVGEISTASSEIRTNVKVRNLKESWSTIVHIVLVAAINLPDPPEDGYKHFVYCKFRLGAESYKSMSVPHTRQPEWNKRFEFRIYKDTLLRVKLCDRGKEKNNMGSCIIDLSTLEKERTHDVRAQLEDGFGSLHMCITMCDIRGQINDNNRNNLDEKQPAQDFVWHNLKNDWDNVGQLYVNLISGRGLYGKSPYIVLELGNQRIRTPNAIFNSGEHTWNKCYSFKVKDISTTIDLKVYDSSMLNDFLGTVSIPLLTINNGTTKWYALKDRSKRHSGKGNCPRVHMEMTVLWNPVKASAKLFQPQEIKHIKRSPKFDVMLIHKNLEFIRDTFKFLYSLNEFYKSLFEWEDRELSLIALLGWLVFWYNFSIWMAPLLLLIPFLFYWILLHCEKPYYASFNSMEKGNGTIRTMKQENGKSLTDKLSELPELTIVITDSIQYLVSVAERIVNLVSFKVPFISYLTMILLLLSSVLLYIVPVNYIFMSIGIHKFVRKYLNPDRKPNNDLLDFITKVPDNRTLEDWRELNVPEPKQQTINSNIQ